MEDKLEFKISPDLIMPIIKAKIETAIIEAMGGHKELIDSILEAYMSQKVSSEGKISSYSSDNKFTRIDFIMQQTLEVAVKDALKEFLANKQKEVAESISRYFASKKGSSELIRAIEEGILDSLKSNWATKIQFIPNK